MSSDLANLHTRSHCGHCEVFREHARQRDRADAADAECTRLLEALAASVARGVARWGIAQHVGDLTAERDASRQQVELARRYLAAVRAERAAEARNTNASSGRVATMAAMLQARGERTRAEDALVAALGVSGG